ncbi:MAG: dihydrofolate reductase family protein [Thermoplasmata archaeon]|nr:MAG: dihydrofolate reductase family protein [Thermoplasmata archaeon]
MLPKVIIHNVISADGRIDGFQPDLELYYKLASSWNEDATLAGSGTIYKPGEEYEEEGEDVFTEPKRDPDDKRPLMVVPDSKGRVRNWHVLRKAGYWRDFVAFCTESTPKGYLDYLNKRHIEHIICGNDKVDLKKALEILNERYGVKIVRVDSGGTLNGIV